ncbi:MAG: TetR/AcrR family transcriptional regulator [Canibacter sp.]
MARHKNQEGRRSEIRHATQRVIARFGPDGARLNRIAKEAQVSSGTVLYYYPNVDDLILEAVHLGIDRFDSERRKLIAEIPDAPSRLESLIRHGLPKNSHDIDVRMFNQLGGSAGENTFAAVLLTSLYDRQVALYQLVLEQGITAGDFTTSHDTLSLARNIVALEDAYGYRIIARHGSIDVQAAADLILDYAHHVLGCKKTVVTQFE